MVKYSNFLNTFAAACLLAACFPTSFDDPEGSSTTGDETTSTTSTSTTLPSLTVTGTVTGVSSSSSSSTTDGDECNFDGVCDEWESLDCALDCAPCEIDGVCDEAFETPGKCPEDCVATSCTLDGVVDPLTEQCDDGNTDNADACLDTCTFNVCGDGFFHFGVEECDDGNLEDGDGCSPTCEVEVRHVFVTLGTHTGDVGIVEADEACALEAAMAGLEGAYMAWLSTSSGGPAMRFPHFWDFQGAYVMYDAGGESYLFAQSVMWFDQPVNPIRYAADGEEIEIKESPLVWTNTSAFGYPKIDSPSCEEWTSKIIGDEGGVGCLGAEGDKWTDCAVGECEEAYRLYCFEVSS